MLIDSFNVVQFFLACCFEVDHPVMRASYGPDQFIQFEMDGCTISVLRILNQEDHQKCHDGGACVNEELPGIAKAKP